MSRSIRDVDLTHGNVGELKRIRKWKADLIERIRIVSHLTRYLLNLFCSYILSQKSFIWLNLFFPFRSQSQVFAYIWKLKLYCHRFMKLLRSEDPFQFYDVESCFLQPGFMSCWSLKQATYVQSTATLVNKERCFFLREDLKVSQCPPVSPSVSKGSSFIFLPVSGLFKLSLSAFRIEGPCLQIQAQVQVDSKSIQSVQNLLD